MSICSETTTFLDVVGVKTQLTVGGDGPPLLYLHSAGGETDWTCFHALLAERYQVYVPAHPGFSLSTGLDRIDDMADLVWHYVDLLDELSLARVPIVGFSLGAWLAVELAIHRPQLVERMVLIDAAGLHLDKAPMAELFIDDLDKLRALLFHDPECPGADQAIPRSLDDPRILNWLRAREPRPASAGTRTCTIPVWLAICIAFCAPPRSSGGREDALIPLAHGEYYAQHIPCAELDVIDQCGHMVPFEKPEELARLALEFLDAEKVTSSG